MKPRILLIEDDESVLQTLQMLLADSGYDIAIARDGADGLRLFAAVSPDIVITDIVIPAADGFAVIKGIRKEPRPTKIIAISGGARLRNVETLVMAEKLGADRVIQKPFEPDDLVAAIEACLPKDVSKPGSAAA